MKFKRFLSLFFVVLLAVCIPCAFLAGCNGNSGDDGTGGNTSDNGSNSDKTGSGDEIFTEGMTLAQLRAATENIDNFTYEILYEIKYLDESKVYKGKTISKFDGSDSYQVGEEEDEVFETFEFSQGSYSYYATISYGTDGNANVESIKKSLLANVNNIGVIDLWNDLIESSFIDGEAGLEINEEEIASEDYQVTSYVRLKGSVLEYGYMFVGKEGTSREGETEQYDIKIYGVNATVIDTSKIQSELADAEWDDEVWYNGYHYVKDVDKDGNEYYYIESSDNSEAEPEKTINTLPVKPRES